MDVPFSIKNALGLKKCAANQKQQVGATKSFDISWSQEVEWMTYNSV